MRENRPLPFSHMVYHGVSGRCVMRTRSAPLKGCMLRIMLSKKFLISGFVMISDGAVWVIALEPKCM